MLVADDPPAYEPYQLVPGAFTARQCDRIVALAEALPDESGGVEGDDGGVEDADVRRSTITWVPPDHTSRWIYDRLSTVAERANRRYGFELSGFGEDLQYTRYDTPGSFYTWHQDGLDGSVGLRKLSIVVQLSDPADYDGAELELFALGEDGSGSAGASITTTHADADADAADTARGAEVDAAWRVASARRGTAIVFPAFEYHRVRPLRSGTRRSLVSWVSGPPFR